MQTIPRQLDQAFRAALGRAFGFDADPLIAVAQNAQFGDYQSNVAMGLARRVAEQEGGKPNPRAVAERIVAALDLGPLAQEVTIAGPGFINVRLAPQWMAGRLEAIASDDRLGVPAAEEPLKVVVDYSGPNVAKQMHVGHLRSTIIGDAIGRVLEFQGHEVVRQNHVGDWGTQFGMLIAYLRERAGRHGGAGTAASADEHIEDLEGFYREAKKRFDDDAAFQDEARKTVVRLQGGEAEERALWAKIVEETRRHYEPIYERLGVLLRRENERGESFYNPFLPQVVRDLKQVGVAQESQGAIVAFVEGYETPLMIEKTGGGYLYATTDLAAIRYRVKELGARRIVYTHDFRQSQHFDQVFQTARKAGWANGVVLEYAAFGTMLGEDGKPFKTRSGEVVKLKDLLDEAEERALEVVNRERPELPEEERRAIAPAVGIGAVKYADLSKDRTSDYVFSWESMLNWKGNSAPYLQYAYARIRSIFRRAVEAGALDDATGGAPGHAVLLEAPQEIALAKHLLRFGEVIEIVGRELKPHHLCAYLYELAARFSVFYEHCPVLKSDEPVRSSRLALCDLTARTMATGLDLLGIAHPEQM